MHAVPSTFSIFFTLETKGKRGGSCSQKEANSGRFGTYSWPLSGLKFFKRSVITVLYVERTTAIHDLLDYF
jgi:hypothetical protein